MEIQPPLYRPRRIFGNTSAGITSARHSWIEPPRPDPVNPEQPDYDHPNAIGFDRDGNYIVSWRNLGQVTKIDAQTGQVLWRLGGADIAQAAERMARAERSGRVGDIWIPPLIEALVPS